jgi:hypothetical protein
MAAALEGRLGEGSDLLDPPPAQWPPEGKRTAGLTIRRLVPPLAPTPRDRYPGGLSCSRWSSRS